MIRGLSPGLSLAESVEDLQPKSNSKLYDARKNELLESVSDRYGKKEASRFGRILEEEGAEEASNYLASLNQDRPIDEDQELQTLTAYIPPDLEANEGDYRLTAFQG